MLATIITNTNRSIKLLALKYFVLTLLFLPTFTYAEELDIADIEKALNTEHTGELSTASQANIENTKTKHAEETHVKNKIVNDNNVTTPSYPLNNSLGEDNQAKKDEPLPQANKAKLIVLNKITTKSTETTLKVGEVKFFGNLLIEVHKCIKATDPYNANNWMLLTIFDNKIEEDNLSIFHGWVLSSNPSLSTLEHPVYEVIPLDCLVQ